MAPRTALVVDDSKVARIAISKLLKERNFNVDDAASGEEALEYLEHHRPDIVFMDVMMPGMGGLEATRAILSQEATRSLPVVMCTGKEAAADQNFALEVGARDVLAKPAGEENLDRVLQALVTDSSAAAATGEVDASERIPTATQGADARGGATTLATQEIVEQAVAEARRASQELAEGIAREVAESVSRQLVEKLVPELAEQVARETAQSVSQEVADKALVAAREQAEQKAQATAEAVALKAGQEVMGKAEEAVKAMARSAGAQAVAAFLEQQQAQFRETLQKAAEQTVAAAAEKHVASSFSRYAQEQGRALIRQIMEETAQEEAVPKEPSQQSRSGLWKWRWGRS
ncbi:response regulator receiver [Nitrosococcus halophilus Nc 4]|uniref:Response regulator receiver n=1 Tax=Nitrosococcus halophilus (strain Nc4) TaxID=472759 RepID=D5BUN7_NITHN|nr:response regulator [Nitrosococcus halophilus]ADE13437.1 response regulator receiver [Nitrosococcus halophilus Nc 4]